MNLLFEFRKKHPLLFFISKRVGMMLVILFVLGLLVFALMSLAPGDIIDRYAMSYLLISEDHRGSDDILLKESLNAARSRLGLDKPFYVQYFHWIGRILHGDLGRSLISRAPVLFLVRSRMINSLVLNLISLLFLTVISFILGIYLSAKAGTKMDIIAGFFSLFFYAFPSILLLVLLQLMASVTSWIPVTAYPEFPLRSAPIPFIFSYLHHILLPLIGAFLSGIGGTLRLIRATMLDQLGMPYVTALRSRGIKESRIYFAHAFRNTMNPFITSSANLLASLFSGSLILEIIFSYPGMGKLMYEAVLAEDVNLVLANIIFVSSLVLVGILISDILLAVVDPRIRYEKKS